MVTLDRQATVLPKADVRVRGNRIDHIAGSIEPGERAAVLDLDGHLLLPGLIQAHVHLGQTLFRGLRRGA